MQISVTWTKKNPTAESALKCGAVKVLGSLSQGAGGPSEEGDGSQKYSPALLPPSVPSFQIILALSSSSLPPQPELLLTLPVFLWSPSPRDLANFQFPTQGTLYNFITHLSQSLSCLS